MTNFEPGDRVTYSKLVGNAYVDVAATVVGASVTRGRVRIQIDGLTDHLGKPKITSVREAHLVRRR